MKSNALIKTLAGTVLAVITLPALAQANSLDVSAGGGLAAFSSGGSHTHKGVFDATALYNFSSQIGVGFNYSYSPVAAANSSVNGVSVNAHEHFDHYGAVVRVGFLPPSRVQPYVSILGGAVVDKATATGTGFGTTITQSESTKGGYVGFGGGASLFFSGNLGIRPEVRYERIRISGADMNELDVTGSLFYRFGGHRH